jgi:hypothetical protein
MLNCSLDHIPFGVRGELAGRQAMAALGFAVVQGRCRWPLPEARYTAPSASIMFHQAYLDLISRDEVHWPEQFSTHQPFSRGLAPSGVVLAVDDVDAALERIARPRPYEIGRSVTGCDQEIVYRVVSVRGALSVALIQDSEPMRMRTIDALSHPNGATSIEHVTFRCSDLDAVVRELELLDLSVDRSSDRVEVLGLGVGLSWTLGGGGSGGAPHPAADLSELRFGVDDLDRVAKCLELRRSLYERTPSSVRIPSTQGFGCNIAFMAS